MGLSGLRGRNVIEPGTAVSLIIDRALQKYKEMEDALDVIALRCRRTCSTLLLSRALRHTGNTGSAS